MISYQEIAVVYNILGVLCYFSPVSDEVGLILPHIRNLPPEEWPGCDKKKSETGISLMKSGTLDLKGVKDDYHRLFIGPDHLEAAPWGSVYLDEDGVLFGSSMLRLREFMRSSGVYFKGRAGEPEDHMGALLLMASSLAYDESPLVMDLIKDHILTWGDKYCELLYDAAKHPLYKGVAVLLKDSLGHFEAMRG